MNMLRPKIAVFLDSPSEENIFNCISLILIEELVRPLVTLCFKCNFRVINHVLYLNPTSRLVLKASKFEIHLHPVV